MLFINILFILSFCLRINGFSPSELSGSKISGASFSSDALREEDLDDDECFEPLQIPCEINGYIIPAIIDTGAQVTVMSESCARRCHVSNMIDARFSGQAIGIGASDILGRINELSMRVGPISYHNKVSILRDMPKSVDLILGLDFLQRFKSEVNLDERILKLKVRGRTVRVSFISNHNGPLKNLKNLSSIGSSNDSDSDDEILIENEESSDDDLSDSMSEDEYGFNRMQDANHKMQDTNKKPLWSNMKTKLQEKEASRISKSRVIDYDADEDSENDDLSDIMHRVSMEGV
jgi:hypothetical protein